MEKTATEAWAAFEKSKSYELLFDALVGVMRAAEVPKADVVTRLTMHTCFLQGYVYRSL